MSETSRPKQLILVVDDEPAMTRLLKLHLEATGLYEVRTEHRGLDGLQAASEFHPDLVLLDIVLPDISGGELAARLQQDPLLRRVPVLFLTGTVSKREVEEHGGMIEGHPFLAKPVEVEELLAAVRNLLSQATGAG